MNKNEEKAEEIAKRRKDKHCVEYHCYRSAIEMAEWKDEQFAKEKKEIDEQWKRLMAESKSIGVDLLQHKEKQLIDEAAEWFSYRFPNISKEAIEKYKEDMKG